MAVNAIVTPMVLAVLVLAILLAALAVLAYRLKHAKDHGNLETAIDREVHKFMRHGRTPAVVMGVYKAGRSFTKGYGTLAQTDGATPDADTVFQIASVSKVFTASLLQVLCDEGVVAMESTLGELLGPSMPLSPAAQRVTLRQLATHTSGFPSVPQRLEAAATQRAGSDGLMLDPYSHLDRSHIFDYLATAPDQRQTGRFEYSNFGMGLLGHVLEIVTGTDYEVLLKQKLLEPLGMMATGITPTPEIAHRLAQGHNAQGAPTRIWTFAALAGAGALHSSVSDLLRFVRTHLGLSLDGEDACRFTFRSLQEPQGTGQTGIGWMRPTWLDRRFGNGTVVWHNGMVGGYASYLSLDVHTSTGTVILSNKALDVTMLGLLLTRLVRTQSWSTTSR